ncbi:Tetratricopeptide TPR_2 repeat protein [Desulfonatronospira thiodismutans ASO3-1]|uniref:Tetratricopeptide TPR_2 repeat protein n=1 Tax=Desulfonatronospira thiodismutans ASO3-1 TaxID=555779 RepID=D6SQW0_9BACT|nr:MULTISPECIES: tetratricopeptide repeat protein [Desulfonatronospira]EFI35136.1 Tetratricopeptide TPR_2 repeat protein [Desulfonatronospira thiodismutans ASO3-1]RQD75623.1 MAG: tetratricopeptide repeat protein [Desulfonatronospira sp. MSAO_Bac3]
MGKKILVIMIAAVVLGCAPKTQQPETAKTGRELTPQAQVTYHYLKSLDYQAAGDHEKAALALEKALVLGPSVRLYQDLAREYLRQGEKQKAVDILQDATGIYPRTPELYFQMAEFYLVKGDRSGAVKALEKYKDLVPEDLDVYEDLAAFYIEMRDYAGAVDLLQEIPPDEMTPEMHYYMGRAKSELGEKTDAVAYLDKAVQARPGFMQAWAEKAFIYEQERDYLQAERIYQQLLKMGERSPDLILRIVELNLLLNDPERAVAMFGKGPDEVRFQLDMVNQFIRNEFYEHADILLQDIAAESDYPDTMYFYFALIAYEGRNDPQLALDYLSRISKEDSYHLQALSFRVQILFHEKNYQEALELSRKGQELHPGEDRVHLFEAIVLEAMEEYQEARKVLEKALEKWPGQTDFLFRKGVVLDKSGKTEKSLQIMEEIIALDQEHHEALNYVGYTLADQDRDLDRAMILIKRALELDPGNGYYIDSLAWVYYRQGSYEKAWEEILAAVEQVDDEAVIWEHYGDIAKALGKREHALHGYEKALELDPENPEHLREQRAKVKDMPENESAKAGP